MNHPELILVPTYCTTGVLFGTLTIVFAHFVWALRTTPAQKNPEETIEAELVDTEISR